MPTSLTLTLLIATCPAQDTQAGSASKNDEPIIQDNSFLVEEAYNQNYGVVQHIQGFTRFWLSHDWAYTFTQEWPVDPAPRNQLSYTIPVVHMGDGSATGIGDIALNYRYQLVGDADTKYAMAPRFTVLLPTGDAKRKQGAGGTGLQGALPVSVVHSRLLTTHWNLGATVFPSQSNGFHQSATTFWPNAGQSFVFTPSNRVNLLLETVWLSAEKIVAANKTVRDHIVLMSPGVRWAYNFKSGMQIVPGVACPIGVGPSSGDWGILLYFSIEHPYRKLKAKK